MISTSEVAAGVGAVAVGLTFGLALLPWKRRLYQGHEWWIIWGVFWPFLLLYTLWIGLRAYRDAWGTYLAERTHYRKNDS